MLQKLQIFAQENPGVTNLQPNPRLIAVRLQENDGANETPPARS